MQKDQQKLAELIQGKKVAFIGAGVSHKTLIKEFVELGAHVTLCDQKKSVEEFGDYAATIRELGIDLSLGEHYLDGFKGQDIIMRTPGFVGYFEKPLQDAMAAGTMVTSEVELFFDFCPCEIVAVTGSDGKTTTTTLISKFYEAAGRKVHLGGNIGAALLPTGIGTPQGIAMIAAGAALVAAIAAITVGLGVAFKRKHTSSGSTAGSTVRASGTLWDYEQPRSLPQRTQRPNIEVNQYIYSKAQTAADLMREAQYEQRRAVLQGV